MLQNRMICEKALERKYVGRDLRCRCHAGEGTVPCKRRCCRNIGEYVASGVTRGTQRVYAYKVKRKKYFKDPRRGQMAVWGR